MALKNNIKRRDFIKTTLIGLPALFIAPKISSRAATPKDEGSKKRKSVIIIGAGLSGLAAANKLQKSGFDVTVLESQEKIGGRLRTNRDLGVAFDEGASWIHGIDGNPIAELAEKAGMNAFHTIDSSRKSYDVGGVLRGEKFYDAAAEDEFYDALEVMSSRGKSKESLESVFKKYYPKKIDDRLWRFFLSTYITFDTGDLDKLSSVLFNEGEEYKGIEKIATNGYDMIAKYLSVGLKIVLNQKVTCIDCSALKGQVTHNGTISEADYIVVTVPLGVLKANAIQFIPDLPAIKKNAIQKVGMNCVNKFLLTWEAAFWDDVQYISYTPEAKDKFNYFVNVKKLHPSVNALMTFAYADYGRKTEAMADEQIIDEIMLHLQDIYGIHTPRPTHMLRTKWQSNENSFGAYSYTTVDTKMQCFEDLAEEVGDKLFFAGEHTEVDYFSTAHGAYLSGLREADKIIKIS